MSASAVSGLWPASSESTIASRRDGSCLPWAIRSQMASASLVSPLRRYRFASREVPSSLGAISLAWR